jgi:hypothetical protein
MRMPLLVVVALSARAAFAEAPPPSRPATDLEADRFYLGVLDSTPYDEALEMLTDVGVPEAKARELLAYLAEHIEDHRSAYHADFEKLCRNVDDQFSNPIGLADEIRRQNAAELEFQDSMLKRALEILGVPSLTPIRKPHMNNGGITDAEIVERILDGRLKPADAISRSCEILKQCEPPPPPEGNGA